MYVCHSEGEWARQNIEVPLKGYSLIQFPVCIKYGLPPKGHPANLPQLMEALESTWASIPEEHFRYLVESMP